MSAGILKAKKQLGDVSMLLKQGKLLAAVANLHEAVGFILKAQLMKHEQQAFTEALDRAAYLLSNDRELKKIYPLQVSYKPGEEKEFHTTLYELLACLQESLAEEANAHLEAMAEQRRKQLEQARMFLANEQPEKARQLFQRMVGTARTDAALKVSIADMFLEFNLFDDALEYLKAAHEDNPEGACIFNKLGMVLRKTGRLEEAEKFYIQALERQTKDEYIYFNLGRVYLDMHRWKDSIHAAERALAINPDFQEAQKMKIYATRQLAN